MLPLRSMMTLMAVLALFAMVAERAMAAPKKCTAADIGKGACLSCKTKAKCEKDGDPPVFKGACTITGETCTVAAGIAVCKPFATTPCSCAKTSQCDPYDPDFTLVCLSTGQITGANCLTGTPPKTCVNGVCVTPPVTTTTPSPATLCTGAPDGFVLKTPSCTSAVYCSIGQPQATEDCASGKYFDMNEGNCLPLPPVPCAGCDMGACPDKSDCTKFQICEGGVATDNETCDAATPDFDIITNECVATGAGTCTGNNKCTYVLPPTVPTTTSTVSSTTTSKGSNVTTPTGSTTTTTTGSTITTTTGSSTTTASTRPTLCTATNVGKRYPFPGNCKKYYSCRLVSTNVYAYVESTCLSTLVFNPATTYCEAPANVPTCVPPA